jgi:two-component system, response regulator PdtaR
MSDFTILVLEDEAIMALDIVRRLKLVGYQHTIVKDNSGDALRYLQIHSPDLILCDINIYGDQDGIDVAEYVRDQKSIPLIFVTALSDRSTLDRAKRALPYGYIVKPFNNRDLLTAIELALYKHSVEVEKVKLSIAKVNSLVLSPLSEREYEILEDVIKGSTNDQIAAGRHVSVSTVKFHISNILVKLEVKNRSAAIHKILTLFT